MSTAMSAAARPIRPRRVRRLLRWLGFGFAWVLGALFAIAAGVALYSSTLPDLRPWHTERLTHEFEASQAVPGYGFDAYLEQEARLFEEVRALRTARFDPVLDSAISRFGPDGGPYAARVEGNWNRSFRMPASPERGVVVWWVRCDRPGERCGCGRETIPTTAVSLVGPHKVSCVSHTKKA
jgi:hypothetical protein